MTNDVDSNKRRNITRIRLFGTPEPVYTPYLKLKYFNILIQTCLNLTTTHFYEITLLSKQSVKASNEKSTFLYSYITFNDN